MPWLCLTLTCPTVNLLFSIVSYIYPCLVWPPLLAPQPTFRLPLKPALPETTTSLFCWVSTTPLITPYSHILSQDLIYCIYLMLFYMLFPQPCHVSLRFYGQCPGLLWSPLTMLQKSTGFSCVPYHLQYPTLTTLALCWQPLGFWQNLPQLATNNRSFLLGHHQAPWIFMFSRA